MGPNALPMFDIDMDTQSSHWFIFQNSQVWRDLRQRPHIWRDRDQ